MSGVPSGLLAAAAAATAIATAPATTALGGPSAVAAAGGARATATDAIVDCGSTGNCCATAHGETAVVVAGGR